MKRRVLTGKRPVPRLGFVRETISELKKVAWPTRGEATHLTTIVIIVSIAVGIILGIIDYAFTKIMYKVFVP